MEIHQKTENRIITQASNSTSGYLSKENKTLVSRDIYTLIFIADIEATEVPIKMKYYSAIKNEILPFVTDGPKEHCGT